MIAKIQRQIEGTILGTLKMSALQIVNTQVMQLIGGSSVGGAMFISNWEQFLFAAPRQQAQLYVNDFFTLTTGGRASALNYQPWSAMSQNGWSSMSFLTVVQNNYQAGWDKTPQYDLFNYTSNTSSLFGSGDWRAFNSFTSNPANNPLGLSLLMESAYSSELERQKDIARTQAISYQGYKPRMQSGFVVTPGITIKDVVTGVQMLPNMILSAAENPAEFMAAAVTSTINMAVNQLVRQGIGQIQSHINQELYKINRGIGQIQSNINQGIYNIHNESFRTLTGQ